MNGNLILALIVLVGFLGVAMMIIGIVRWFVRLFPQEARASVLWMAGTVMCFVLFGAIPFVLAVIDLERRGLWSLVTTGGLLWCLGLALIIRWMLRPEPDSAVEV